MYAFSFLEIFLMILMKIKNWKIFEFRNPIILIIFLSGNLFVTQLKNITESKHFDGNQILRILND